MKPGAVILSVIASLALAMMGCGGGGDGSSGETLTKAEFIVRADRICFLTDRAQGKAFRAFFAERPGANKDQGLNERAVIVAGLPPIRAEAEELDALPAPEGDEDKIQAIVDGIEEAIEVVEEDPGPLVNAKDAGPFTEVDKLTGAYGFKACAFVL